ncbi:MAG: PfkB family carbohydrate kinase [Cyanobacteria bacterium P01_E01_bin.34]
MTDRLLVFGEVLFDCFPDGQHVLGGAPFNVAWNLQAFGLSPLFISRVGADDFGAKVRHAMVEWGMDTSGLQMGSQRLTGVVDVELKGSEPSYTIRPDRAFDFVDAQQLPPFSPNCILYHGTLGVRNFESEQSLETIYSRIVVETPQPKIFVDANLRAPWWTPELVDKWLSRASWLKVSEQELQAIVPREESLDNRITHLLNTLQLETLIVTRGELGAIAVSANGKRIEQVPSLTLDVVDTVGAGDAFSSVLLLGMAGGWPLTLSMQRAQEFANAVVGIQGATSDDRSFYEAFSATWH